MSSKLEQQLSYIIINDFTRELKYYQDKAPSLDKKQLVKAKLELVDKADQVLAFADKNKPELILELGDNFEEFNNTVIKSIKSVSANRAVLKQYLKNGDFDNTSIKKSMGYDWGDLARDIMDIVDACISWYDEDISDLEAFGLIAGNIASIAIGLKTGIDVEEFY
ncbi:MULTISPECIES: hypothetical protein [Vibrio harveyi group]|uniref:hypothetical protein n=1 Tax=Vibrio harveyi group TaxID=717610 RepID=UPI0038CDB7F9